MGQQSRGVIKKMTIVFQTNDHAAPISFCLCGVVT